MKRPPFEVTLRNGAKAVVFVVDESHRLFPLKGRLVCPPMERQLNTEEWRTNGRWRSNDVDHQWDIVDGLVDAAPDPVAQHETTEVL